MPGPKMGARPHDFDENIVRQAPTFIRWQALENGQKLRYSCRDFIKGHGDDEERLMRRIMIARRNNLRDHEILKRARMKTTADSSVGSETEGMVGAEMAPASESPPPTAVEAKKSSNEPKMEEVDTPEQLLKKRRTAGSGAAFLSDDEILQEIDLPAVERTRSYKAWCALKNGKVFTYNQRYVKGKEGHEWFLKKNIWRRMRYRRENKMMIEKMKKEKTCVMPITPPSDPSIIHCDHAAIANAAASATRIVDRTLLSANHVADLAGTGPGTSPEEAAAAAAAASTTEVGSEDDLVQQAIVEAAVAAAESYVQNARESDSAIAAAAASAVTPIIKVEDPVSANSFIMAHQVVAPQAIMGHVPIAKDDHSTTPNNGLLAVLNDDALDVAAKLAAAASMHN